jgi:hypothetical protein
LLAGNALEICGWPKLRPFRLVFVMSWCSFLCMPQRREAQFKLDTVALLIA